MSKSGVDIRRIAINYRDELLDELARLDAFIEWADAYARAGHAESDIDLAELYDKTGAAKPHVLH